MPDTALNDAAPSKAASVPVAAVPRTGALDVVVDRLMDPITRDHGIEPDEFAPDPVPEAADAGAGDEHVPQTGPRLDDLTEVAAYVMLRRALAAKPGLRAEAREPGAVVVVEVPDAEWVDPTAEAWRCLVRDTEDVPQDGDDGHDRPYQRRPDVAPAWSEFRRDGLSRTHKPDEGNGAVRMTLAAGRPIYGFSPFPGRNMPSDLMRAATAKVVIGPLDSEALAEVAAMVTGAKPVVRTVPAEVAALVSAGDLWLARRPGQDADGYLERLTALASRRRVARAVTLDDLHGMDEAVRWGRDLKRDLTDYASGALPWREVDRGTVLVGPTGTGKTTFARALAAHCGVPLVTASLAEWQGSKDGHLGTLLGAMRATFDAARKAAPCILLVDEIDSFGDRTSFRHRERDYSIQVVNAFLEELDGARGRDGVVVVGCCNDASRLDPAILRPGRLERLIRIPTPDRAALAAILRHHLGADLLGADLTGLALNGLGATGAEAERWVRGMRRRARHEGREPTLADLETEMRGGGQRLPDYALRRTAVHEAGHAVVTALGRPGALVSASIQRRGNIMGRVVWADRPGADSVLTRALLGAMLCEAMAGRAAEEELLGEVSAGSGGGLDSDLAAATRLATVAVTALGLDHGGGALVWRGMPEVADVPEILAARPDVARRVSDMLDAAYAEARAVVRRRRTAVERLTELLMAREVVEGAEIEGLVAACRAGTDRPGAGRRTRCPARPANVVAGAWR